MNTKKFSDLTRAEKKDIVNNYEAQMRAFQLEAIARGIAIPISLPDHLKTMDRVGYHIPEEAAKVYEICVNKGYSNPSPTGICFITQEAAERALQGCLSCYTEGYGKTEKWKLVDSDATVMCRHISLTKPINKSFQLEEVLNDVKDFEKLCDELSEEITAIRQEEYNRGVNLAKRSKYLELANGDETIARNFWAGMEKDAWPEDEPTEDEVMTQQLMTENEVDGMKEADL